jgi:hypothetical protein
LQASCGSCSAGGLFNFYDLEVTVVTKKKTLRPEIERFKHILIEAYQRGELSTNITAKDMVRELAHQLKPIFKGNNHK